jgi:1,4-alpha-glucan branching enzyme
MATIPSTTAGMGSRPLASGGTSFRVWAPFAPSVAVAGSFNSWDLTADQLASEGDGYWSVDVPSAVIGSTYQYIIPVGAPPLYRRDPYVDQVDAPDGNGIIVSHRSFDWSDDHFSMPTWDELVIYEMHIGTFSGSTATSPGTFASVIPKMQYLQDLGVTAIQIMPVMEFPDQYSKGYDRSFYWGYEPSQPFSVETAFGGPAGLFEFVKAAHAHGIAVILDVVYNHFGTIDSDLWQFDGWSEPGSDGGIYIYENYRAWTGFGARPNFGRPEVRQFLRDNALFWLDRFHIDGLRFDSVINIRQYTDPQGQNPTDLPDGWSLLQWINDEIGTAFPWKITIAEDLQNNEWITKPTGDQGAGFDSQWDPGFRDALREVIITSDDGARNITTLAGGLGGCYNGVPLQRVAYIASHDEDAYGYVPELIWPGKADSWASKKRSTLGAGIVFTAPGIPMIFQGQEFLEDGEFQGNMPLDWNRLALFPGINQLYRDIIRLRRNLDNATLGLRGSHINVHHVNDTDKVIGYHRWQNGGPLDDVIVLANCANCSYDSYTIGFPRAGLWRVRFNSDWNGYSSDFNDHPSFDTVAYPGAYDNMPCVGSIGIGQYSMLILSQDS